LDSVSIWSSEQASPGWLVVTARITVNDDMQARGTGCISPSVGCQWELFGLSRERWVEVVDGAGGNDNDRQAMPNTLADFPPDLFSNSADCDACGRSQRVDTRKLPADSQSLYSEKNCAVEFLGAEKRALGLPTGQRWILGGTGSADNEKADVRKSPGTTRRRA
jgi:hypothetical protein